MKYMIVCASIVTLRMLRNVTTTSFRYTSVLVTFFLLINGYKVGNSEAEAARKDL